MPNKRIDARFSLNAVRHAITSGLRLVDRHFGEQEHDTYRLSSLSPNVTENIQQCSLTDQPFKPDTNLIKNVEFGSDITYYSAAIRLGPR